MKTKTGKLFLIYFAAAIVIASVIRFFQYVTIIDYRTGFFAMGSEAAGMLIYIVLAVLGAGLIGLTVFGYKKNWTALTVSSDGMGSKATLILGVAYLLAAAVGVLNAVNLNGAGLFRAVSCWAFAVSLGALGLCLMKSTVPPMVTGFINLFPALYFFMLATELFTNDLVVKNRSDSLIVLLTYVFGTLFFASGARFLARLETKLSRSREIITGGLAFIFSAVHVLSKVLAFAFGGDAIRGMDGISAGAIMLMIISGGFLITICTTRQHKEIDYLLPEKKEDKDKDENEEE